MNVILRVHGKIVIHDVRNSVHVDPARGNVGRDQNADRARFEIFQRAEPLVLRAIRMDRARLDAAAFETARDPVGAVLRAGENEDGIELRIAEEMEKQRGLQVRAHFVNKLRHGFRRVGPPADLDNLR